MVPRFYVPTAEATGSTVELPEEEASHLLRVLRLTAGAAVRVFDGRGREWHGVVDRAARRTATVRLLDRTDAVPEAGIGLMLAVSVLKGDKMDHVIRDSVMLGVARIQPLITTRTEVPARSIARGVRTQRWQRIAIASAKQCGRSVVPPVDDATSLEAALATASSATRVMLTEPHLTRAPVDGLRRMPRPAAVELYVGPEGGWTDEEVRQALDAGSMLATLGGLTLRADAVPLVALTVIRTLWDDF